MVRIAPLLAVPAVLAELGSDSQGVLAELGLDPGDFRDPERTFPFAQAARILEHCAAAARCEHFALLVGRRTGTATLGVVGKLMLSCATAGAALERLAEHLNVHDRGAVTRLRVEGNRVSLGYSVVEPGVERVGHVHALAILIGSNIMRDLCGPTWRPDVVRFAFARPRDVEPYRRCFQVLPRFDAEESALVFPARTLAQPLPGADDRLNAQLAEQVRELECSAAESVPERVRRLLSATLGAPDCSLATIARRAGKHERTLKRHLAAAGTSYHAIRDDVRFQAAREFLVNTHVALGEIAFIVGYSDASSFSRAFQRWSGMAPREWRAAQRAQSGLRKG
jgi:AraC-like DNA-binding protein